MSNHHGTHNDLHADEGARRGEHPGRAKNPVIKVEDLAWLEFQKPDLAASEQFAHAFGFATVSRTADELQLRGTDAGSTCVIVRRGPSKYVGAAFRAVDSNDVLRLADATGATARKPIDGYLASADLKAVVSRHGLIRDDTGSVTLRATSMDLDVVRDLASVGDVLAALDLAESLDVRERRAGIDELDRALGEFRG